MQVLDSRAERSSVTEGMKKDLNVEVQIDPYVCHVSELDAIKLPPITIQSAGPTTS